MGRVIDPSTAFRVCHGFKLDDELMLWSKGVIGTLSDSQEKLCDRIYVYEPVPPELVERQGEFSEVARYCSRKVKKYPKGDRLQPYLECVSERMDRI